MSIIYILVTFLRVGQNFFLGGGGDGENSTTSNYLRNYLTGEEYNNALKKSCQCIE